MNRILSLALFSLTLLAVARFGFTSPSKHVAPGQEPEELKSIEMLLEQRRDTLVEALQGRLAEYKHGNSEPDRAIELNDKILAAELELASDAEEGVQKKVHLAFLRTAKEIEALANARLQNGTGTRNHVLDAKAQRLLAEINIVRLNQ